MTRASPGTKVDIATRPRARSVGGARGERMATTKSQSRRRKPSSSDDGPVAAPASARASTRSRTRKGPAPSQNGAEPQAVDTEATLDLYRKMNAIRFFEDAAQRGFRQGKIGGYLHLYSGQEAVATGLLSTYQPS